MEQHGHPSQPQYASGSYVGQQTPHTSAQAPGRQYAPLSSSGRFQQQPPSDGQPAPAAPAPLGRVGSTAPQVYGFPPGAPQYGSVSGLPSDSMQYAPNLHAPAPQRPMQQSQYQPYGGGGNGNGGVGNVMYGIAQPQSQQQPPQPAAASAYEPGSSSYRQRPHAASDTLATFGVPPAGAQYYLSGSTVPTATSAAPDLAAQQAPSQYQPRAHHAHAGPSTQPSYASTLVDASRSGVGAPFAPPSTYESQTPVPSIDQIFRDYQTRIRTVFTLAYEGSLRGIDTHLLQIAERLLGSAEALGQWARLLRSFCAPLRSAHSANVSPFFYRPHPRRREPARRPHQTLG